MIISKTPFRISFFGGGTDYPDWYEKEGGEVLSTTIDKYCYLSLRYKQPFLKYKYRIIYTKIENVNYLKEIKHPLVREILKYYKIKKGLEIHHDADLPARTGLGSSSSFAVGLLHCLSAFEKKKISKTQLARKAIHIERNVLHENVGSQDQVAAAFGGFNQISFSKNECFNIKPVKLKKKKREELKKHLLLYFTGTYRIASNIVKEQLKNIPKKRKELQAMKQLVSEAVNILTGNKNISEFGKLLSESWELKKSLSQKISNPMINEIYRQAIRSGAIGGKLLGAGAGGFMLFFVPPENQKQVRKTLKKFLEIKFCFENQGSKIFIL